MSHEAFISYANKDKAFADGICAILESHKIRCWIASRDVIPGSKWAESIVRAIESARVVVVVFSANSNASDQVLREVERSVAAGTPIIPIRIEDVPFSKSLEYFLGTSHWLDALSPPLEKHIHRLAETIRRLLASEQPVEPLGTAGLHMRDAFFLGLKLAELDSMERDAQFQDLLAHYRALWESNSLTSDLLQRFIDEGIPEAGEIARRGVSSLLVARGAAKEETAFRLGFYIVGHTRGIYNGVRGRFTQTVDELAKPIEKLIVELGLSETRDRWLTLIASIRCGSVRHEFLWKELMAFVQTLSDDVQAAS